MIKEYVCYEAECEGVYTSEQLQEIWESQIDKSNFLDFEAWLKEMEKLQILISI